MYFQGKSIADIRQEEIQYLIDSHVRERDHLEFKLDYDTSDDSVRLELLKDVVSFANSGGGYILIGIRDDGQGRAQKFVGLNPKRIASLRTSISALCNEHIDTRILGLEVETKEIDEFSILIIRIPASASAPHMVSFRYHTHFCRRYGDGKREMTLAEIRSAFNDDYVSRRLDVLENMIRDTPDHPVPIEIHDRTDLLRLKESNMISDHCRRMIRQEIGNKPYFYISLTPNEPQKCNLSLPSDDINRLVRQTPGSRSRGWSMGTLKEQLQQLPNEMNWGNPAHNFLTLIGNGHMEFRSPLDHLFCRGQTSDEFAARPRLYPYAVCEYPLSFIRLYSALAEKFQCKQNSYLLVMEYLNFEQFTLPAGHPDSPFFDYGSEVNRRSQTNVYSDRRVISLDNADEIAYTLLQRFYASFNYSENVIPFFDKTSRLFNFNLLS